MSDAHTASRQANQATPARVSALSASGSHKRTGPARDRDGYADETPQVARSEPKAEIERGRANGPGQLTMPQ